MSEHAQEIIHHNRMLMRFLGGGALVVVTLLVLHSRWLGQPAPERKVEKMMIAVADVDAPLCSTASPMPALLAARKQSQAITNGAVKEANAWVSTCSEEINQRSFVTSAASID